MTGKARVALVVLGMHGSGASALSGVLTHLGCTAPLTQVPARADGSQGFFESQRVRDLNDRILKAMGSSWRDWRPLSLPMLESSGGRRFHDEAASLLAEEWAEADLIVLRDPRICRLLPVWTDVLRRQGYLPLPVLIHRDPFEVAQSLRAWSSLPLASGLLLWLRHVLDAERLTRGGPRAFTSYEQVLTNWRAVAGELHDRLGLALPLGVVEPTMDEFLSTELRHWTRPSPEGRYHPALLERVRSLFSIMERWVASGEDGRDHGDLDRMHTELTDGAWAFVDPGEVATAGMEHPRAALSADEACTPKLMGRMAEERQRRVAAESEAERLRAALGTAEAHVAALEGRTAEEAGWRSMAEQMLGDARAGLAEALVRIQDLDDERGRQAQELGALARLLSELRGHAAELELHLRELLGSTTWRAMEPARRMIRFVRRQEAPLDVASKLASGGGKEPTASGEGSRK